MGRERVRWDDKEISRERGRDGRKEGGEKERKCVSVCVWSNMTVPAQ